MNNSSNIFLFEGYTTVCVNVIYYLPDYSNLLNEFVWTTVDIKPKYPRIIRFIDYWKKEIDGKIKEVILTDLDSLSEIKYGYLLDLT